jgi:pyridoxal phosphate enzyme (YggS family)
MINKDNYTTIINDLAAKDVTLVAVSKTKPAESIKELYELGQRDFGENYVQELVDKQAHLPQDINWHFIGHLQTNKVKYIASFVYLIHGVDSYKLLREVNKQALKLNKVIHVLLQVHIAQEETKFGLDEKELEQIFNSDENGFSELQNIQIEGFMGMASFTENKEQVRKEFRHLKSLFDKFRHVQTQNCKLKTLSMGMSGDYLTAIEEGSNMVRIGSLIFGDRK